MDALFFYDLDESGQLTEDRSARFECAPGAGPRQSRSTLIISTCLC